MRVSTLLLVLALGVMGLSRDAIAEKVKSNQETKLFARPGERAKVLITVSSGKAMTVLAKEGRWLKVRVQGRTGYVARSTVDQPDDDELNRNTRRRSFVDGRGTKRGFDGQEGPDDRIGADAVGEGREDGGDEGRGKNSPAKGSDDEEDDEEDEPVAKSKPPAKTPPSKTPPAKTPPAKGKTPLEEDDEENPVAAKGKTPAKTPPAKTPPVKTPAKGEDEDDKPVVAKGKPAAKGSDDDDEDEGDSRKAAKIALKTTMYTEADTKSESILVTSKDTALYPTGETKGKFTEVENDEGDLGYVLTASIQSEKAAPPPAKGGGKAVASRSEEKDEVDEDDDDDSAPKRERHIDVRLRGGVSFLSQGLRSPGGTGGPPQNYNISTAAMTIALGAAYYRPSGKSLLFGAETTYDYAKALPGIKVPMGKTTSVSLHNLNVRAVLGLDFHKKSGMMLLGRAGIRFESFQVANAASITENTALLPSEVIYAPMIGAALAMPMLTNKVGLRFSVDVQPATLSYKQTKNLEDGKSPSAKGAIVGVGFTYRWKKSMDIQATYDLTYMSASFGDTVATSARMHPMGGVTRTDMFHAVTAGIVKAF